MSSLSLHSLPTAARSRRSAPSYASSPDGVSVSGSEKLAMQNLNDRLAAYLQKVRALEAANAGWERKIREWQAKQSPDVRDYSKYQAIIDDLRSKISAASQNNTRLILEIDNAKLAASDFELKLNNEKSMRMVLESDIMSLRKTLDDLTVVRSDLEMQIEGLKEELVFLKKNHAEELEALRKNVSSSSVNVELDAKPQEDLSKVLEDVRNQYNSIAEKSRQEMEAWYKAKFDSVNKKMASSSETLQTSRTEINELRKALQALQIELQSQLSMKSACEGTLAETEMRYSQQLNQLQAKVNALEAELSQIKADMERQASEYQVLLNVKTRLEMEIAEYRRLLDGQDEKKSVQVVSRPIIKEVQEVKVVKEVKEEVKSEPVVTQRTRVVIEELVDGKVVSRTEQHGTEVIKK